jgi:hypothetical protein
MTTGTALLDRLALAWAVVMASGVAVAWPSQAGEPTPADVLGVDIGTPQPVLGSIAASALTCREFGTPTNALACKGGLGKLAEPAPDSTTYWLADGRVSKIFAVYRLADQSYGTCLSALRRKIAEVAAALGRAADVTAEEPSWLRGMDQGRRQEMLAQGRLSLKAVWRFPRRELGVSLHADRGTPVVVVGLTSAGAPTCDAQSVATMLMNLFPPASPATRMESAQDLAACKVTGAAGALAAAAKGSEETEVQLEAVRALGAIGPAGKAPLQDIANEAGKGQAVLEARALLAPPPAPPAPAARAGATAAAAAAVPAAAQPPVARRPLPAPPPVVAEPSHAPAAEAGPEAAQSPGVAHAPEPPSEASPPEEPEAPKAPPDGTALALTTSLLAGGVWGGGLSLLAQQDRAGVVMLVGSAGAVIGGGTAWGLIHFGLRPSPSQALWFTNSTTWGTLAGLLAWAGSGSDNLKLKWGLLVGGETIGMGMGVLGARQWEWTPSQILFANSLVLGAGLGAAGGSMLIRPTTPFHIGPVTGYGAAPAMVGAAVLSRYMNPTVNDVHLLAAATAAGAWSGGLLAYGLDRDPATRTTRLGGGFLAGMGAGYLGAAVLSPFVEVSPKRTWVSGAGLLAGNLIGLGSYMVAAPDETTRRPLWAGLGGLGLGMSTFLAYPHLRLGEQAPLMGVIGAGYGAATWGLAMAASNNDSAPRAQGGALAIGTASGIAGLLASSVFYPAAADYPVTLASGALGAMTGIGAGKLATGTTGTGELVGTLVGSAAGFGAGAAFTHYAQLRLPDLEAGVLGAGYGAALGALAPTLAEREWGGWQRRTQGSLLVGLPAGAVAGVALSHLTSASSGTVAVAGAGAGLGLGMGLGLGLLWRDDYSQPARIGSLAGTAVGSAGALLLERRLHLAENLGEAAGPLGFTGAALGVAQGVLLAGLADPSGQVSQLTAHQAAGGAMLGGSAGLATGLVLSRFYSPGPTNLATVALGDVLGAMVGRGLAMTIFDDEGRKDTAATLAGSLAGLGAVAVAEHVSPFTQLDLLGGGQGLVMGGIVGSLAPTLADRDWGGWRRSTSGGLLLGMGGGALAGAEIVHLTGATPETLVVGGSGAALGLGMGLGAGLLWPTGDSQPARIGTVAGLSAGLAGSLLLEHPLHLDEGLGEAAAGLGFVGAGIGVSEGVLLAGLVDPSGQVSQAGDRQIAGGVFLGGAAGLATGLIMSKYFTPDTRNLAVTASGTVLGGLLGRGLMMTASSSDGRPDTAATMAGALSGAAAFALAEHLSPQGDVDLMAGGSGLVLGGVVGALAPTLGDRQWDGWQRRSEGSLLLGLGGGALAATGLAHATGLSGRTLGLGLAGAVDGAFTGAGIGLLADPDATSTQGARIGVVAGTVSGLAIGLGLWPHLSFAGDNLIFMSAAAAVGGWTGAWAPVLGHASLGDVETVKVRGGLFAGAGGASILATALVPALHLDRDVVGSALLFDAIFSGAGAGGGALASRRADAPVWGMLGAGTAGLLLGGVLHDSIDLQASRGLVAFAGLEGLWAGAWLPYLLRPAADVKSTDHAAGLAAGGLGGVGLSLLASAAGHPGGERLGMAGIGSAIGASVAGGSVLMSQDLHDQRGVGILLGGTAAGLGLGALVEPYAPLSAGLGLRMVGGAGLGLSEGLAFAWAGRGTTQNEYAGAALVGAGVGATLGLASSADAVGLNMQQALVASGFSAWGGWVGSFAGAFANRDPHEVVLGGLAAANLGFLAGYGALRWDLVEPRDFGWLSLAGAMGAAVGGGVGAALSSQSDPRPVVAGLAIGPAVGLGAGAFIVPHLRHKAEARAAYLAPPRVAGVRFDLTPAETGKPRTSADVLAERRPSRLLAGLKLVQHHLFEVTDWTPVFGALPPAPGDPNPAPLFMGIAGGLR